MNKNIRSNWVWNACSQVSSQEKWFKECSNLNRYIQKVFYRNNSYNNLTIFIPYKTEALFKYWFLFHLNHCCCYLARLGKSQFGALKCNQEPTSRTSTFQILNATHSTIDRIHQAATIIVYWFFSTPCIKDCWPF